MASVSTNHLHHLAAEQILRLARVHMERVQPVALHDHVGERRPRDLLTQGIDLGFDLLLAADEISRAVVLLDQIVQQPDVDLVADAQGEDACARLVCLPGQLEDLVRLGQANRRLPIGDEHDLRQRHHQPVIAGRVLQGVAEGVSNVGAAHRLERVDAFERHLKVVLGRLPWPIEELVDRGGEGDDLEVIDRTQALQERAQRGLRLLDLGALHRA